MFDDLKQDKAQPTASPQSSDPTTQAQPSPASSPKAKNVSDMFGDVDPVTAESSPAEDKPSAIQSGKIKPVSQTNVPTNVSNLGANTAPAQTQSSPAPQQMATPNIPPASSMAISDDKSGGFMRKFIVTLLVVVLLAVVGGAVYYFFFRTDGTEPELNENQNTNTNVVVDENVNEGNEEPVIDYDDLDDDFDGLSNGDERNYGTNPLEADSDNDGIFDQDEIEVYNTDPLNDDSDNDGLSDYEEIIVYKTQPNDPDTDGDTFLDGVEVNNGYNPLGEGKLEEIVGDDDLNTNENI